MGDLNSADILNNLNNLIQNNPKQMEQLTDELARDPLTVPTVEIIEKNNKLSMLSHLTGALTIIENLLGPDITVKQANEKLTDAAMIEYIPCLIKKLQK